MQENTGNNSETQSKHVYKADTQETFTEMKQNKISNKVVLSSVHSDPLFINQGVLTSHSSFICMDNNEFNLQCISNENFSFSGIVSQKKHGQVCLNRKFY